MFAVFFAVFGIPLGRLADVVGPAPPHRVGHRVLEPHDGALGPREEFSAARARRGWVSASARRARRPQRTRSCPTGSRRRSARRSSALYSSGIYIGAGLGLGIGGFIVDRWDLAFPTGSAPFGLRGWQAAFLAVGLPGLLLAAWVRSLVEPARAASHPPLTATPIRMLLRESAAVIPPFTLFALAAAGAGTAGVLANVAVFAVLGGLAALLTSLLGNPAQWIALGAGLYAVFSWAQALRLRSREDFDLVFRNRALVLANLGFGLAAFGTYGTSFWIAPYFVRFHHLNLAKTGLLLGGISAAGGWLGATSGGLLADAWGRKRADGRLLVGAASALVPIPLALGMLAAPSLALAAALALPITVLAALWVAPATTTAQELVPPRLRGTASAVLLLHTTFLGLALGPYTVGRLSLAAGSLRAALALALPVNLLAGLLLVLAARALTRPGAS